MVTHLFTCEMIAQLFDALSFYADYPEQVNAWIEKYSGHAAPLLRLNPFQDEVGGRSHPIVRMLIWIWN
jgi:hypothetical protein